VNRSPIRYGFCVGAQAIRYSVDIALVVSHRDFSQSIPNTTLDGWSAEELSDAPFSIAAIFVLVNVQVHVVENAASHSSSS